MSILTEEEMDKAFDASMAKRPKDASNAETRRLFAVEVESAVLAKIAGMDLPEPAGRVQVYDSEGTPYSEPTEDYTAAQLRQAFAQGAASQLSADPIAYGWKGADGSIRDCIAPDTHAIMEGQYDVPLYTLKEPK